MIEFYLPDFYYNYRMNAAFVELQDSNPELFFDDVRITAVYGSFPVAIWNGGRAIHGYASAENIKNTIKFFEDHGVAVRYTFTNCLLEKSDFYDRYCNDILEWSASGNNEIIVNNDGLRDYIEAKYPNRFRYISSTTKRLLTAENIEKELEKGYYLIVLDYELNNTDQLIKDRMFLDNASKFELLINAYCKDHCELRTKHYEKISEQHIMKYEKTPDFGPCKDVADDFYTVKDTRKSFIHRKDIFNIYVPNGYTHFKIEGRCANNFDVLESYLYYMIKPEHRDRVRLKVLRSIAM